MIDTRCAHGTIALLDCAPCGRVRAPQSPPKRVVWLVVRGEDHEGLSAPLSAHSTEAAGREAQRAAAQHWAETFGSEVQPGRRGRLYFGACDFYALIPVEVLD